MRAFIVRVCSGAGWPGWRGWQTGGGTEMAEYYTGIDDMQSRKPVLPEIL